MITAAQLVASVEVQRAAIEDHLKNETITEFVECNELLKEFMCGTMVQRLNSLRDKEGDEQLMKEFPIPQDQEKQTSRRLLFSEQT